ncbi:MAG: hypothetical protein J5J06_08035 [Phycisphaerae bacterium]|nr:hypothetical protein [Phycisphaerae bacterium]
MAERKPFLLRLPPDLLEELGRWAKDDLRSLSAQIEYVLREAVRWRISDRAMRRKEAAARQASANTGFGRAHGSERPGAPETGREVPHKPDAETREGGE